MLSRLRTHIRHNVVGYLALFFALTGVAYAAGPLKAGDPATGDLTGTYPGPNLATGVVKTGNFSSTIPAAKVTALLTQGADDDPSSITTLDFGVETYDTADLNSVTNPSRLTAPVAGIYRVSTEVTWQPDPDGNRVIRFIRNGSSIAAQRLPGAAVDTQDFSTELKLAAGDYMEVGVTNAGAGGPLLIGPLFFTMSWVAPG